MASIGAPVLLGVGLAAVHVVAGRIRALGVVPRSYWLSLGGGVSVAYVFVHLLPEITHRHHALAAADQSAVLAVSREQFLFVALLAGFATFYGLEQLARRSRREPGQGEVAGGAETRTGAGVFWVHVGSFAAYNVLIGYLLLHRETPGTWNLLLYFVAMAVHFVVNDYGLRHHHEDAYDHVGRWVLAGAVLVGLAAGYVVPISELHLSLLFAFLAGGIVLNVIKEELPEDRQSRFWAFVVGVAGYATVLLAV